MNRKQTRRDFVQQTTAAGAAFSTAAFVSQNAIGKSLGKPAMLGGQPVRTKPFPQWPIHKKNDEEGFLDALKRDQWCRLGAKISDQFDKEWAERLGCKYSVGVVNGTNALYAALYALDVGPGDEVILSPYTFIATLNAVIQVYALPVFSDSDRDTQLMDAGSLEERITDRTRAIIPVHLGGSIANMDAITKVAKKHNLGVVEDACQAHYAEWRGKRAGTLGDVGCFSFQASKILPCGEGGSVVTDDENLFNKLHAFQNNGRDRKDGTRNGYQWQGSNLRITEYQSALLISQLSRFEEICEHREENVKYFDRLLEDVPGVSPSKTEDGCTRRTYYIHLLRYDKDKFAGLSRSKFQQALSKEGTGIGGGYRPLNKEPFLKTILNSRGYQAIYSKKRLDEYWEKNHCPQNDLVTQEGLFMSQRYFLGSRSDVEQVVEAIMKIQKHAEELANA